MAVRVIPRARRTALDGIHAGALKLRVTAPPVDGAANDAVVSALAEALGISRHAVRIAAGAASRTKTVVIQGMSAAALRTALSNVLH